MSSYWEVVRNYLLHRLLTYISLSKLLDCLYFVNFSTKNKELIIIIKIMMIIIIIIIIIIIGVNGYVNQLM